MDGSAVLGAGALGNGVATFATAKLTSGRHSITAIYYGNTGSASTALRQVPVRGAPRRVGRRGGGRCPLPARAGARAVGAATARRRGLPYSLLTLALPL